MNSTEFQMKKYLKKIFVFNLLDVMHVSRHTCVSAMGLGGLEK